MRADTVFLGGSAFLDAAAVRAGVAVTDGRISAYRERGLEQLADLRERRASAPAGGRFRPTTVKIMQDGIAENFTAAMTQPYRDACGCSTGFAGLTFVDPDLLRQAVTALDADGFQVHLHTLGDRAVREALDALEVGRDADLAVHDRNPFAGPAKEIGHTVVLQTWISNCQVHSA